MKKANTKRGFIFLIAALSMGMIFGCSGFEYNTKHKEYPYGYIHKELPVADRAVEAARQAGKDKQCPGEFKAAEDLKNKAYEVYRACRTQEAIAMAKEATAKAQALCPPVPLAKPAPAPAPEPARLPAPTSTLAVTPGSITQGQSAALSWTSQNAENCDISPNIGPVQPQGTMTITPSADTAYTLTCTGAGGSTSSAANIVVTALPPAKPAPIALKPEKGETVNLLIEFDNDKAIIKPKFYSNVDAVGEFMKQYPRTEIVVEGHTDNVGSKGYNQKLSLRRAEAVRKYIVDKFGIEPARIKAVGYGLTKPVASNKTAEGRYMNRRVQAVVQTGQ